MNQKEITGKGHGPRVGPVVSCKITVRRKSRRTDTDTESGFLRNPVERNRVRKEQKIPELSKSLMTIR